MEKGRDLFEFALEQQAKGHYQTSLHALNRAIEEGSVDAICELGLHYRLGTLVEDKDEVKAKELFLRAAELGHARAMLNYGRFLQHSENEEERQQSEGWFRKAFIACEPDDPFVKGRCHHEGLGCEKDLKKAIDLYWKAVHEQDHKTAKFNLANCYWKGEHVEKDLEKAFELYHESAKSGFAGAMLNCGNALMIGEGVEKQPKVAFSWYKKAAEQGFLDAQCNLALCLKAGDGCEIDLPQAAEWFRKSADRGLPESQCCLGIMMMYGEGIPMSLESAFEMFKKSAASGHSRAQCFAGICLEYGQGVEEADIEKAMEYYEKSAATNFVAQSCLGRIYKTGHENSVRKDLKKSLEYYRKAAVLGYDTAREALKDEVFLNFLKREKARDACICLICIKKYEKDETYPFWNLPYEIVIMISRILFSSYWMEWDVEEDEIIPRTTDLNVKL